MSTGTRPSVGNVTPDEAWRMLKDDTSARLIDVRSHAEWGFVGVPDLDELGQRAVFVEWASYPAMSVNPRFAAEVEQSLGDGSFETLLFLCRSGSRSLRAAHVVASHFGEQDRQVTCLNVAEGFEGDLDPLGHRGTVNGWKARGLAWRQS